MTRFALGVSSEKRIALGEGVDVDFHCGQRRVLVQAPS
jgi:hypothetical protein